MAELPRLLTLGACYDESVSVLCDFDFPVAKIRTGNYVHLAGDYQRLTESLPDNREQVRAENKLDAKMKDYIDRLVSYAAWHDRKRRIEGNAGYTPAPNQVLEYERKIELLEAKGRANGWQFHESGEPDWIHPHPKLCSRKNTTSRMNDSGRIPPSETQMDAIFAWNRFILDCHSSLSFADPAEACWNWAQNSPLDSQMETSLRKEISIRIENRRDWLTHPLESACIETGTDLTCVAMTPDARIAVTGNTRGLVQVWDLSYAGERTFTKPLLHDAARIQTIAITPDGKMAACWWRASAMR